MTIPPIRISTRTKILDATDRLLARYGYRKITMEDIAQEAKLARRTIYQHFATKEEIAFAVLNRGIDLLLEELTTIANSQQPPLERLRQILIRRVLSMLDRAKERYFSYEEVIFDLHEAYMLKREEYFQREVSLLATVLEEGREQDVLFYEDAQETALCVILATNALMPFSLSECMMQQRPLVESRLSFIVSLILRGLTSKPFEAIDEGKASTYEA